MCKNLQEYDDEIREDFNSFCEAEYNMFKND
jgi:hypothetical protein